MANEVENLLVRIANKEQDLAATITWGIHKGITAGAEWITVFADGRVQRRDDHPTREDQVEVLGPVPHEGIKELVDSIILYGILALALPQPVDLGGVKSLQVSGGDVSWSLDVPRSSVRDLPQLADLERLFEQLWSQAQALAAYDEEPPTELAARPVAISTLFKVTAVVGGLMTCGLVGVMLWVVSRHMPKTMDGHGLKLRNGRSYAWKDLTLRERVTHDGQVMGVDLLTPDDRGIRLAGGAFQDGEAVVQYALERMAEQA